MLLMQTVDQALAGVVVPSGAGTLTIGPQAMEGNLQIRPGDSIKAGYDFTMPGPHAAGQITFDNASITMAVTCANGTTPPAISFALPVQTYTDPAGSSAWYPSGDQSNAAVYQGSVIAPDLCAGGIMSDAKGATFKVTIFSTNTSGKVNVRFHYSDNTAGSWSVTATAPVTPTAKTVLSATLTPKLGLTLAVDHSGAIPGDTLTYSGTVTNTGATLTLGGDFTASASGSSTATVKSYWDNVTTSLDSTNWTALAGTAAAQSGYTPAVAAPITSGMTLTSTPVAASGVTYPTSGDPLLGTTIPSGSSALWHYAASVPLTPSQVTTLLDPTKVKAIRNSFHLEVSPANPSVTQPSIINVDFSGIFLAARPAPSGSVTNVSIIVQPPTGPTVTINSGTVAGLALLAPGGSATYSTTYKVPVPAVKGTGESDAAYQARLAAIEGLSLSAGASASGGSTGGPVNATAPAVSTTEHLPIVSITKTGPTTPVAAGTSATYPLALKNSGGATASGFAISDTVPSGDTGTVSGPPASLAAGASSNGAQATYAVPAAQTPGNLTDTASVSWLDANGNGYGPVSSSFTTVVQNTLLGARLTLALAAGNAGLNAINASQGLQLTLLNSAGAPIPNQAVTINVTGSNPITVSVVTDSNGQAIASYSGKTSGVDQLQATASSGTTTVSSNTVSVTWINPIQPIATTPVQGNFFAESSTPTTFIAKPGDTAAFQQSFPTINFNPPTNTVTHNVSGVGPQSVPFTDVTTDAVGNFAGTIVAQGNGVQAGAGPLASFDGVFAANFVVAQPGDVTFNVIADDGFLLGVGGGASRTSGTMVGAPASGLTPFDSYQIVGSYNQAGGSGPATYPVTIHFPSAGVYPYELDYFECCGAQMSLTMTVVSVNTGPYNLSTGYADTIRPAGTSSFPFPWNGAANTTFIGGGSPYDTGGLRFDNNTNQPITLNHVTVDIGTHHFDPWNLDLTVPANGTLVLANPTGSTFDTSEAVGTGTPSGGGSGGFIARPFATGFATCCGGIGPVGVAFDNAGNLFAMNYATGFLYKFGPTGGVAGPATQVNANSIQGCPAGLAFSKDGKHLYLAMQCLGTVLEIDQATGAVLRTVASGISAPTGIATDPLSGDLFVSQPNGTPTIQRIQNPTSANPPVSVYSSPGSTDGIAFGPDGTLYGSTCCQQVVIIAGTNATSPGTVLTRIQNSALAGNDGIALLPPPPGAVGTSIVVNSNNGFLVEIDNPQTASPTFHNIVTGGSRGDFAAVGPDHCLYASQTDNVEKVTSSDGTCPFAPSICLTSPTVPQVHVTVNGFTFDYNDTGLALTSGGIDGECTGNNESAPWQQIGGKGGPVNTPLPPAMTLGLQAAPSNGHIVGQSQAFTVAAMDGAGHTVPNVAVQLGVSGVNPQQLSGTTDLNGTATFSYTGSNSGTDTVSATAFISGLRAASNAVPIQWTIPAPGGPTGSTSGPAPSVVVTSPPDGSAVSQPVAITATIAAPSSSPINFWSAQYQNVSGGSAVTLVSGTSNPPATLATFDPTGLAAGTYALTVTATTSAGGGATAVARVIVGNGGGTTAQAPPTIGTASPADGTVVTKPVPVTATIAPPSGQTIASWRVTYQALDVEPMVSLASGTGTPPSPLATFDPTLLPNDTYTITITATASGGGIQTLTTTVAVFGNLKLGRYVTTFQDLSIPVNGFQMEVRRTYDSIDKRVGDFGFSWHVELANFRVSANRQLGAGGWSEYPTQCIFGLCFYTFKTSAPHLVTVTFPDQHQEIFDFTPQGGAGILYWQGNAAFTARAGTSSTLEVAGDASLSYDFAGNLAGSSGYYNPTRFKLTTHDGRVLVLDTVLGLVSATDRNGNSLTIDGAGVHASNGQSITFTRDSLNRITQISGPVGSQTLRYAYSPSGDLQTFTDPNGNSTAYNYDTSHGLLSATGSTQSKPLRAIVYDAAGRVSTITDANGNSVALTNNVGAQQQVLSDPMGTVTAVLTFDDLGDLIRRDETFGGVTLTRTATYDNVGRPLTTTDPLQKSWTFQYDGNGSVVRMADPSGVISNFAYNGFGQLTTVLNSSNTPVESYTYDATGNLVQLQRAGGATYLYTYTAAGLLASETDPLNAKQSFNYDAAGHLASYTDAAGNSSTVVMDAAGRLQSTTNALTGTTSFQYDGTGNLRSVTDGNNHTWAYGYDALNRRIMATDPLQHSMSYQYDGVGNLQQTTNRDGQVITQFFDANGRITSRALPGGDVTTFSYDPVDRLTAASNSSAKLTFAYDAAGRISSTTTTGTASSSQPTVTQAYSYDATGRPISASGPGGTVRSTYDAEGRLSTVVDPALGQFTFSYDTLSGLTSVTRPNGVNDTLTYDAADNVLARVSIAGTQTIASSQYGYDANGARTGFTTPGGANAYTHDGVGRLIAASHPVGTFPAESYQYDRTGNRTSSTDPAQGTMSYDAADRLTADATYTYAYSNEGDLTLRTSRTTGAATSFDWNALHQLLAIHYSDGTSTSYRYDPVGRRIEVNASGQITRYVYDDENIALEYDGSNALAASYVSGGELDAHLEMVRGGGRYYYLVDGQGSTSALTDATGTVVATYVYDSFGRPSVTGNVSNPFTFTGREYDGKSGFYYYRARYYDPSIGRFLSEDPEPALNPYPYVLNNPVDFTDPTGREVVMDRALINTFVVAATVVVFYPVLERALSKIVVSLYAVISDGIGGIQANYAKGGRQNVKHDWVIREAIARGASMGHDQMCAMLQKMYEEYTAAKEFGKRDAVRATQKALGCRRHG